MAYTHNISMTYMRLAVPEIPGCEVNFAGTERYKVHFVAVNIGTEVDSMPQVCTMSG